MLLDTNILIDFFHNAKGAVTLMKKLSGSQFGISVLTVMEIVHGAHKTKTPKRYIGEFHRFLSDFSVIILPINEAIATTCGETVAAMERHGITLGVIDALLAATALIHSSAIVTEDAVFRKIPGLDVRHQTVR